MRKFSVCILLLLTAMSNADIRNVPSEQYPSIQQAINLSLNGDVIVVAPGRYYENINFFGKVITVRSTDPNDSNVSAATIIDGNRPADINSASVVTFKSGETSSSIIEGFTITGGTGSWLQVYWEFKGYLWNRCGGGVFCTNYSAPTIQKNIITKNLAGEGGGIYCYNHSNATIVDNNISDNNAIADHGFADPNISDPNIYDHGDGGAIVGFQYCNPIITNNTIQHNHATGYGGGIHLRQWSDGLIENNLITQNVSMLGAGVHLTYTSAPTIRKNTITANTAGSLGGGGIYIYYLSSPLVEQNFITQNSSSNGAGIGVYWESNPLIRNNFIVNNIKGAGILIKSGSLPNIINNTIVGNGSIYSTGGGIECVTASAPVIKNNIIASNPRGYGIYASNIPPVITFNNVWGNSKSNYNSIIGEQTGINGNISQEPLFAGTDNYHILPDSLCVNAGDSNAAGGEFDIDNEERIFNLRIDIGADECVINAADFDNDGIVDFADFSVYSQYWLNEVEDLPADFVDDGFINFSDFAIFAENWLRKAKWR